MGALDYIIDYPLDKETNVDQIIEAINESIINKIITFIDKRPQSIIDYEYADLISGILEYYQLYGKLSDKQKISIALFVYDIDELYNEIMEELLII